MSNPNKKNGWVRPLALTIAIGTAACGNESDTSYQSVTLADVYDEYADMDPAYEVETSFYENDVVEIQVRSAASQSQTTIHAWCTEQKDELVTQTFDDINTRTYLYGDVACDDQIIDASDGLNNREDLQLIIPTN